MKTLPNKASLRDLQSYISAIEIERGFDRQTMLEKCLLLGEELGELFKAVRYQSAMGIDVTCQRPDVAEEIADVMIFLVSIANRCGVDMQEAVLAKEQKNKTRTWK